MGMMVGGAQTFGYMVYPYRCHLEILMSQLVMLKGRSRNVANDAQMSCVHGSRIMVRSLDRKLTSVERLSII